MSALDLLARPKRCETFCEVCRRSGVVKCPKCSVTFYCTREHRDLDAVSFHRLICKDFLAMRGEQPFPIEEADRQFLRDEKKKKMMEIKRKAESVAKELVLKDHPELAYSPAMQAFQLARDFHGDQNLDIVFNYGLLAEVFLGLGKVEIAHDYMLQAALMVERLDRVVVTTLTEIQRLKGKVYIARGLWERANCEFADYVYCLSELHGTSAIELAVAYGYLGLTIKKINKDVTISMNLFNKMAFAWLDYLLDMYASKDFEMPSEEARLEDQKIGERERLILEAVMVFKRIDQMIQDIKDVTLLHNFVFKLFSIQVLLSIREGNDEKKKSSCDAALQVAGKTRMTDAVKEEKRKYMFEILGEDYLTRWDQKYARDRTIATTYLEHVRALIK